MAQSNRIIGGTRPVPDAVMERVAKAPWNYRGHYWSYPDGALSTLPPDQYKDGKYAGMPTANEIITAWEEENTDADAR